MADYGSLESAKENYRQPISSFLCSLKLLSKGSSETECVISPTSILDSKPFSALKNPFWSDTKTPKSESKNLWEKLDSKGVSLGLIDALTDEISDSNLSKMVLFGSQLKIQVNPLPNSVISPESPKSPGDFGIKTKHSHVGSFSPSTLRKSQFSSGVLSSEMELSEDYTCVISYGPNPKTTHIFDDCIVESCCGVVNFSESREENGVFSNLSMSCYHSSDSFLSFCYNCKKNLGEGKDIYMFRGEKAFCSSECRCKEMMLEDEAMKTSESDEGYGASS